MDNEQTIIRTVKLVGLGLLAFIFLMGSWFSVAPGHVGVTYSRVSANTQSHGQGLSLKLPILTGVKDFDVQTQRIDIPSESASKDLQKVDIDVALNYHLLYDKVNDLFVKVGTDYVEKVIKPAVMEAVKSATAQMPVEEIIVKREFLKNNIETMLTARLASYNIALESVNLIDIKFDPNFNAVVEAKQIEEQKIKTAEYVRRQAEENKKATILNAEAQAEAQRLQRGTLTADLVTIEWIKKWNGELPSTVLGDKNVMMVSPKSN